MTWLHVFIFQCSILTPMHVRAGWGQQKRYFWGASSLCWGAVGLLGQIDLFSSIFSCLRGLLVVNQLPQNLFLLRYPWITWACLRMAYPSLQLRGWCLEQLGCSEACQLPRGWGRAPCFTPFCTAGKWPGFQMCYLTSVEGHKCSVPPSVPAVMHYKPAA